VDFDLLRPHIRSVELKHKAVLVRTGGALADVNFPHNGITSSVVRLADGDAIEAAMVGRDSVFGTAAALDGLVALNDAIAQLPPTRAVNWFDRLRAPGAGGA